MKIVFAGTPTFALPALKALMQDPQYTVCAVITQPDRPAGRGRKVTETPVKQLAQHYKLPIYQPLTLKTDEVKAHLQSMHADVLINVAYGLLIPLSILNVFPFGCLNIHPSLLPKYRGASPIQAAILSGDSTTGVTIMKMDAGLDTGPIVEQVICDIDPTETAGELENRLAEIGATALLTSLEKLSQKGTVESQAQDENKASMTYKIQKNDAKIDWTKSAQQLHREIRAFNPWPIAYTTIQDQTIRLWQAIPIDNDGTTTNTTQHTPGKIVHLSAKGIDVATGDGILRIEQMQFPGGKPISIQAILNSKKDFLAQSDRMS